MNYLGFRYWKVTRDDSGIHLRALVLDWEWNLDGITHAVHCPSGYQFSTNEHTAPREKCSCGLHAWRHLPDAIAGEWGTGSTAMYQARGDNECLVAGAVVTGGLVCLHGDEGLRAQQARPVAFGVEDRRSVHPLVRAAANRLGIPVFTLDNLDRYAGEFGDRQPQAS